MKHYYLKKMILFLILCAFKTINAQERSISGTVRDQKDGLPLPGVSVTVRGTNIGTQTGANGGFTIRTTEPNPVLHFSYIGYTGQQISVGNRTVLSVALVPDATQLGEVVVTALGVNRQKNELPYAAQQVGGAEVTRTRGGNFVNALSGKVAGLNIKQTNSLGGSTNVIIRGYKSINGNNQALFVIDGVPVSNANTNTTVSPTGVRGQQEGGAGYDYGNAAADINPDDIESINVLKGAAATALYGSRAANGAIIVTTKKGHRNSLNVTVNSGVTFGNIDKTTFAEYQNEYGAGYSQNTVDGTGNVVPVPGFWYRDVLGGGQRELVSQFTADASYGPKFDPSLLVYQWDALDPTSPTYLTKTPWVAAINGPESFYRTSVTSNQNVTISGGGETTTFKAGYTRNDQTGVLPNSKITKDLFNFSGSYEMVKNLTASASANFSKINGLGRYGTGYDGKNPNQQFRQWWQTNVDIEQQKDAYFRNEQNITWNWQDLTGTKPIYSDNPYWTRYKNFQNDTRNRYFGNAALNWKVNDWFDIVGRVGIDGSDEIQEERIAVGSTDVAEYARFNRSFSETNFDLLLNFNKNINEDISFRGLLGANLRRSNLNSIRATTNGGLVVPELYSLSNTISPIEPPVEQYQRVGVDGHFANATFGYKEILFLDGSIRRDQSTTLPKGNDVFWYPSIAGSLLFSNLVKETAPWLSLGKIRLNYAEVGNDAPPLSVLDVYEKPTGFGSVPIFSIPNTKSNSNLKPERTKSLEAGIETAFFSSKFGFDFTWYKTNTVDQITDVTVSSASGYTRRFLNAGEVQNKGIELTAFVNPVGTSNSAFSWNMNINFARNRSEVISLYEGAGGNIQLTSFQGGVSINAAIGQPYGVIRGTGYNYHENGQPIVNAQGYYTASSSNTIIGDPNPEWTGGVANTFRYKDLSLNFLIDVSKGGDVFSLDQWYGQGTGLYPNTVGLNDLGNPKRNSIANGGGIIQPGVKADGTPNDIRVPVENGNTTAYGYPMNPPRQAYVYDASYVKLRELALNYSFPDDLVSKIRAFKGIDVSLIGRNLWIIHKNLPYSDPEEALSSGNFMGYQSGAYPAVRTIGFNVRFRL